MTDTFLVLPSRCPPQVCWHLTTSSWLPFRSYWVLGFFTPFSLGVELQYPEGQITYCVQLSVHTGYSIRETGLFLPYEYPYTFFQGSRITLQFSPEDLLLCTFGLNSWSSLITVLSRLFKKSDTHFSYPLLFGSRLVPPNGPGLSLAHWLSTSHEPSHRGRSESWPSGRHPDSKEVRPV